MNPLLVWRKQGDYIIRGKMASDKDNKIMDVPSVPYACYRLEDYKPDLAGDYFAAFGLSREAKLYD